jgi:RNA chaperone Hfq
MPDRKLIRPALRDYRDRDRARREAPEAKPTPRDRDAAPDTSIPSPLIGPRRKQVPPEQTNAENFYFLKQMGARTPLVVLLLDGEEIHGWIEWYDRDCVKIHTHGEQNYLVYKHAIKYIYKERQP